MEWSDLPSDPRALLTAAVFFIGTRWLWPMAQAKLEEVRARAKAAAHDLAKRYAFEAVKWSANEGRRLGLQGDQLEALALQHLRAISKNVKALKDWTEADLVGILRDAFEDNRQWWKHYERDVAAMAKSNDAALARLERAGAAADKLNAERTQTEASGEL